MTTTLTVTTISRPNACLTALAQGAKTNNWSFIVAGDGSSPADFHLEDCDYLSITQQRALDFSFALKCPANTYARKNVAYLRAMKSGASVIVETDDDNMPQKEFWNRRIEISTGNQLSNKGWTNVYKCFTEAHIWPRGFPLAEVLSSKAAPLDLYAPTTALCPIQQGLADSNPDVDAVYRLILPLPQFFANDRTVILASGSWCPFNSQNTTWFKRAFRLMYLPVHCSFRMTDIWRSFVAQRIAWENGWSICFHSPTVSQSRNEHNLLKDFEEEIPGYLLNQKIVEALNSVSLGSGEGCIASNMLHCYEALGSLGAVGTEEMELLSRWLADCDRVCG